MPITLTGDDEHATILRAIYEDPWTWDEFKAHGHELAAILDSSPGTVHVINDLRNSHQLPTGFTLDLLHHIGQFGPLNHERLGMVVTVEGSPVHSMFVGLVQKIFPKHRGRIVWVDTLDQAYAVLAQEPREGAQS